MSVASKLKNFLSRHKNKFLITGAVVAGSVLLTRYAQRRLCQWQEREAVEFLERNRKMSHFESIGRTCNDTVVGLSAALCDEIYLSVDTDEIIERLKTSPENKLELWEALKVAVFSRAVLMIYSIVMLSVTLKIQFSILGGYLYKDPASIGTEVQEKYLSLCQNFIKEKLKRLQGLVENEVKKCVDCVKLSKKMKLSDIEAIFWAVQASLAAHEDSPIEDFGGYIFSRELPNTNDVYSNLLRDTADFLESDDAKSITNHCVNRGFVLLVDQLAEFYDQRPTNGAVFVHLLESQKPLAKLLPIINGLLSRQSFPQHFVQQLIVTEKLQVLSANIYESLL